jgi:hypothetical protein
VKSTRKQQKFCIEQDVQGGWITYFGEGPEGWPGTTGADHRLPAAMSAGGGLLATGAKVRLVPGSRAWRRPNS